MAKVAQNPKNGVKTSNSNVNKQINKALNQKSKATKKKKSIYDSDYGKEVLMVNKKLKEYTKTFKGAFQLIVMLKAESKANLKLTKKQAKIISACNNNKMNNKVFTELENLTQASKAGNYSPFAILKTIRKNQKALLEIC